jgi:saccharopine dehydrogenase-like NADP-dependent oxidoreductase
MIKIAVVGGHGQVGQEIVKELTRQEHSVVLMGRNSQKMGAFAKLFSPVLEQREVDLAKAVMPEKLADLDMVIVCLDQTDTRFIEQCQNLGIDYLDISANSDFLKKVDLLPVPKKKQASYWFRFGTRGY